MACAATRAALEFAGAIFAEENGEEPGVRLKGPAVNVARRGSLTTVTRRD